MALESTTTSRSIQSCKDTFLSVMELEDIKKEIAEIYILQSEIKYLKGKQNAIPSHV